MKLALSHSLTFSLGTPGRAVAHLLVTPSQTPQQKVERWSVEFSGFPDAASFRDGYGNRAHLVSLIRPEPELTLTITGMVETTDRAGVLGKLDFDGPPALYRRLRKGEESAPEIIDGLVAGNDRIATLHALMERIHGLDMDSAPAQTQSQSQGEADDAARPAAAANPAGRVGLFIRAARTLGFPARHVNGYVLGDDGGTRTAWAEAWDDGLGWIGFDPALNVCPVDSHIRVSSGLDAENTAMVRAVPSIVGDIRETLTVAPA